MGNYDFFNIGLKNINDFGKDYSWDRDTGGIICDSEYSKQNF